MSYAAVAAVRGKRQNLVKYAAVAAVRGNVQDLVKYAAVAAVRGKSAKPCASISAPLRGHGRKSRGSVS